MSARSVLLLHEPRGEPAHRDWMIERPGEVGLGAERRRLITFRVAAAVDPAEDDAFDARRIADHRAVYLEREGELSGGRGRVTRVRAFRVDRLAESSGTLVVILGVGGEPVELRGRAVDGDEWEFVRVFGGHGKP